MTSIHAKPTTLHPGDRVIVAGQLHGYATFLGYIDETHAWVQFPHLLDPTPVAVSFLTPADQLAAS
jgi:hypothetical protein